MCGEGKRGPSGLHSLGSTVPSTNYLTVAEVYGSVQSHETLDELGISRWTRRWGGVDGT